jgi:predicted nucleic acid-binding protein
VPTLLAEVVEIGIVLVPLYAGLVPEALELLPSYPLRAADALHVATARRAQIAVGSEFYVVSADREIIAACHALGVTVLDPEAGEALDELRRMRAG